MDRVDWWAMGSRRVGHVWNNLPHMHIVLNRKAGYNIPGHISPLYIVVQSLSQVQLFATPWTVACQASLSITNYRSLLKLMSIELVMPSNHLILCHPLLLLPSIFPESGSFPMSWLFVSGGQSTRASASVLPMNIQAWFPLGLTVLISLLSKKLSRVFSNTKVQKHLLWRSAFFMVQLYIHTWLLEKPKLWLYKSLSAKWCLCFLICCLGWS